MGHLKIPQPPGEKHERDLIFSELREPKNWAYMAWALHNTAVRIDWTKNQNLNDWRYLPIYLMLMGFVLENLLKGILIGQGQPLDPKKLNHGLKRYADQVKGLKFAEFEKEHLARLEPYVRWAGRYPMPKTSDDLIVIGHSKQFYNDEIALCQKLYDHLRTLIQDLEPTSFSQ
ncbi:MAG TPA: hypothetical protein VGF34_14340 [Stellaceae bacterium]